MQIPLPETIRGSKVLPKQVEYLLNYLNIGTAIISRPAAVQYAAAPVVDEVRGAFIFNGVPYFIWGQNLYKDLVFNLVGPLLGFGPVKLAVGTTQVAIVTGTANANYVLAADGVTLAVNPTVAAAMVDVTWVDHRFLYVPADGSPASWSDVDAADSVQALSFFDQSTQPNGGNVAGENIRGDYYLMGAGAIERFRNVGPFTAPFLRVPGGNMQVGYVGGKVRTQDSCAFVGRSKDNGYSIYLFAGGGAQIISTQPIDELLNRTYTPAQLALVKSQRFNWRGKDCLVFEMPDRTLLWQEGKWSYIAAGNLAVRELARWPFYNALLFNGVWYVQSVNALSSLTDAAKDTAGQFSRQVVTFMRQAEEQVFTLPGFQLGVAQGAGVGTIGIAVSKNGKLWGNPYYRDLGAAGDYDRQLIFQAAGGFGRFDGFAGICIISNANADIAIDSFETL